MSRLALLWLMYLSLVCSPCANARESARNGLPQRLEDLRRILGSNHITFSAGPDEEEEEEDDDDDFYTYGTTDDGNWNRRDGWYPEVKEPKPEGLSLLMSGEFGRLRHQLDSRMKDNNMSKLLLNRGTRIRPTPKEDMVSVRDPISST